MTNVSNKMLFAFAVFVSATVLSLGAFATTVQAADLDGGFDLGGGGGFDYGSYDLGGYDYGNYDVGGYDYGNYDVGGYDYGNYDVGGYDYGNYDVGGYDYGNYDVANSYQDQYVEQYMDQYAAGNPIWGGSSMGGGSYGGSSMGGGYSMPSFSSTGGCTTCHPTQVPPTSGCTRNCYPTQGCTSNCNPRPTTPACTTCGGSNVTNINTNTNTWIDNSIIDNSINGSFNTNITTLAPIVPQQQVVYQQPMAAPYCVITLTGAGQYNTQATLVWSSSNAQSAYISQIGAVAPNGTRYVTGYANQTYSLTVTGQGGTYTCQTQMFSPTYVPPTITPSVSLTQIPYTGLALGPVGNAIYWLSLFSVAAAGAYLLVYLKGGALAFVGASMTRRQNHFVVSEQEAAEVETPADTEIAEEEVEAPAFSAFSLPTMSETKTRDTMEVIRNAMGVPQIIINRA